MIRLRAAAAAFAAWGLAVPALGGSARITPEMDHVSAQETMDRCVYGDTVWVAPGKYMQLTVRNGIRLISEAGPAETIFRYGQNHVFNVSEVDSTTLVQGFTLDGVKASEGVLVVEKSKARIKDCVIKNGWSGVRGIFSEFVVEDCTITDCQNGIYLYESAATVAGNRIQRCINAINLVNASPRIVRNTISGNSLGILVTEHSDPQIGGSLASANRIFGNAGGAIKNDGLIKREGLRTMTPLELHVPHNYWGTDCPDSTFFRGDVDFKPWVDETGTRSLATCASAPE
ncbi:MAG: NosD domain-containing protein [Candidatus Eiseniibacteriota bacterium]